MHELKGLLDGLPIPPATPAGEGGYRLPSAHLLGGELPQGHLHVWSAPPSAGKTAFLLGLALDAARRGRRVLLATYDLPAPTLALRLLAMESGVPLSVLDPISVRAADAPALSPDVATSLARARSRLASLPLAVLEARGLPVSSLEDRLVRYPRRFDVLGVDFAEAVVRGNGAPLASTFRDLSTLAQRRWVAVVAISRTAPAPLLVPETPTTADRVGWLEPAGTTGGCEARIVTNRHGAPRSCHLRLDPATVRWLAD